MDFRKIYYNGNSYIDIENISGEIFPFQKTKLYVLH